MGLRICYLALMCGRFNIIDDPVTQLLVEITGQSWVLETEYNIAPTQTVPVLVCNDEEGSFDLRPMRWWLTPYWSDGPSTKYSMFNAKSETLEKSRAYKEPFRRRRCIIPASGYYEWKKEGQMKLPYYIEPEEEKSFAFAGLWDRWERGDQVVESCTIVTAAAPEAMKSIHHRIPLHLTQEQSRAWMSNATGLDQLQDLMKPEIRVSIRVTPVSTVVNNARNKDHRCVERLGDSISIT